MRISAVLDSSAFSETYFNSTYEMHAEDFLNGIQRNGLLIVDSENKLQNAIFEQIESLPIKYRQQLQILVAELFKNKKDRVVKCCLLPNYTPSENSLDLAFQLKRVSQADVLIVGGEYVETLRGDQKREEGIVLLSEHLGSDFEKYRQKHYERLKSTKTHSKSEVEDTIIHSAQFNDCLMSIVNEEIFASRQKLVMLLAQGAPHEELEEEFREFFEDYCELAFELEAYEESILGIIKENEAFAHLKHRVLAVEAQREISPLGREGPADGAIGTW